MKYTAEFVFAPREHVEIVAFDMNVKGRVLFCSAGLTGNFYEVEYANGGRLVRDNFIADQLATIKNDEP